MDRYSVLNEIEQYLLQAICKLNIIIFMLARDHALELTQVDRFVVMPAPGSIKIRKPGSNISCNLLHVAGQTFNSFCCEIDQGLISILV